MCGRRAVINGVCPFANGEFSIENGIFSIENGVFSVDNGILSVENGRTPLIMEMHHGFDGLACV